MEHTVQLFKALADKNRIRILKMLEQKPLCVCEITAVLGLAASTTSKHLSILKDAGYIFEQKDGKWVNYHLNRATRDEQVREVLALTGSWLRNESLIDKDSRKTNRVDRTTLCKG